MTTADLEMRLARIEGLLGTVVKELGLRDMERDLDSEIQQAYRRGWQAGYQAQRRGQRSTADEAARRQRGPQRQAA